ncbi:MAG TPA: ChbG/HpnK family deacetylase [Pseudolabrys sp.]|nr:ChbG/HpnK family deacetylase [Pseudolabrys sp.]
MQSRTRRIWLCADDYGISPGVSTGIRELIARERLNATSVMVVAPHFDANQASALQALNSGKKRAALGLHVTLTAPFKPLTEAFAPMHQGAFPPLATLLRRTAARRLHMDLLVHEISAQLRRFLNVFGRAPDFVDGHQHVQLFPQIRDAFLKVTAEGAPDAWVRQCGRAARLRRLHDQKALTLDILSLGYRRKAKKLGIKVNRAFAGTYAFGRRAQFADLFPRFLSGLPDGGLVMCHPGFVDAELKAIDSLTDLREQEFAFFASDAFPEIMAAHSVELERPR